MCYIMKCGTLYVLCADRNIVQWVTISSGVMRYTPAAAETDSNTVQTVDISLRIVHIGAVRAIMRATMNST